MTYFLIFVAVAVAAAAALYVVGLNRHEPDAPVYDDDLAAPVANLPPVLLPLTPEPADVDKLRFSLGLRGYRMDQVDEALDRLRDELTAKDQRISALEATVGTLGPEVELDATAAPGDPAASEARVHAPGDGAADTSLNG